MISAGIRKNSPDGSIHPDGLTKKFVAARKASGLEFQESPPTFHEIRSLSRRLYEKQNDKAFAQKAAGVYNGNDDAEISQNEGERVRDAVKDRISKFGHISDIFGQTKINPSKSKTQKKTEYDSFIRRRMKISFFNNALSNFQSLQSLAIPCIPCF